MANRRKFPLPLDIVKGGVNSDPGMVRVMDADGNTLFTSDIRAAEFIVEVVNLSASSTKKSAGWSKTRNLSKMFGCGHVNHSLPPRIKTW